MNAGELNFERYRSFPFSIVGCYGGSQVPVDGLTELYSHLHAFGQFLRFITVVQICDYVNDPLSRTPEGDAALALLRRPSLGHWISVARTLGICLAERSAQPFLSEWVECRRVLERTIVTIDGPSGKIKASAVDAIIALRNALAHGAAPPDPDQVRVLNRDVVRIFQIILDQCSFLADVAAVRVIRREAEGTTIAIMRGFDLQFETRSGEERFTGKTPVDLYLKRRSDPERWIPADPLLVGSDADQNEPMLTFDGVGNKSAYYIGVRKRLEFQTPLSWLSTMLFAPPVSRSWMAVPALQKVAQQTIQAVEALRGTKYFPESYQDRAAISATIEELAREPRPARTGLLLAAESGGGKTSLLAHTTLRLIGEENSATLPVLVSQATAAADGQGGPIIVRLAGIFDLEPDLTLDGLLAAIEKKCGSSFGPAGGKTLLLMVDALNEFSDPLAALRDFDALVHAARRFRWLRCLGTIRRGSFDMITAQTGGAWIRNTASYYKAASLEDKASIAVPLLRFSIEEAAEAWERHRRVAEERDLPRCNTPFEGLSSQVQESVRHPLILEMTMRLFAGRSVSQGLTGTQLFEFYHDRMLLPAQRALAEKCASACICSGSRHIPPQIASGAVNVWAGQRSDLHRLVDLDPIQQLLELGALSRRGDALFFTHQLYLEFLARREIAATRPTISGLLVRISNLLASGGTYLEEELNALRDCLFLAYQREGGTATDVVDSLATPAMAAVLVPFFVRLRHELPGEYAGLTEALLGVDETGLEPALELVRTVGDRDAEIGILQRRIELQTTVETKVPLLVQLSRARLRSGDIATSSRMLDVACNLLAGDNRSEAAFDLLCERGYHAFFVGRSLDAVDAYAQALTILDDPFGVMRDADANRRRTVLHGLGCAAHNLDRNDQALESHEQALAISRSFGDRVAQSLDLVNLADAQWGCGDIAKALEQYDEALRVATGVWYDDGRDVAMIGKGAVLASIGDFDAALRLLDEGITLAAALRQDWDRAWGLVYRAVALLLSNDVEAALAPSAAAQETAQSIEAGYLTALARSVSHWAHELHVPGESGRDAVLMADIAHCDMQGFAGPRAFMAGTAILHAIISESDDGELQRKLDSYAEELASSPPIKGPLEFLVQSIQVRIETNGRRLDVIGLEAVGAALADDRRGHMSAGHRQRYDEALQRFGRTTSL